MPIDILVVCTGNVCRSPYVAARLAAELPDQNVVSAGTGALVGRPPTDPILDLLGERAVPIPLATARSLGRSDLRAARLVLTAERRHRVEAARIFNDAGDRTFTLLELARILRDAGCPVGMGIDDVVGLAAGVVGRGERVDHEDDLADPYGGSADDYRRMVDLAEAAMSVVVPALREGTSA